MTGPGWERNSVRIERTIPASPARVFRAFLDPELMAQWMAPGAYRIDRVTVDPRVGGRIHVSHSRAGVFTGSYEGLFLKIVPERELVYRWAFVGTEPEKGEYIDTLVSVQLRPAPGGATQITIVHEQLEDLRLRAPHIFGELRGGWNDCFDKLERVL